MDSELKKRFISEVLSGDNDYHSFFKSLESDTNDSILDLCRYIISTIDYADNPGVVKTAFTKLAHSRDLSFFSKFKKIRDWWQNTYINEYEYIEALFENATKGLHCNCDVYQDGRFNVPPYQNELDEIERSTRNYEGSIHTDLFHLKCTICKREWEVEVDYSYHYPHSHWRRMNT